MAKYSLELKHQIVIKYLEGLNRKQFIIACWNKKESTISVGITIIEFILR